MLVYLSAEVLLVYLLRYFPVGKGVHIREMDRFCDDIKKQVLGLGYAFYAECDNQSLDWEVRLHHPSQYEVFMDEFRSKRRIEVREVNAGIPEEIKKILDNTAQRWAKNCGF